MNSCIIQRNAVVSADNMGSPVSFATITSGCNQHCVVVCPKPRRVSFLHYSSINHHPPPAMSELLDIILSKGGGGGGGNVVEKSSNQVCSSPPSRVSNPLIQDACFGEGAKVLPQVAPVYVPISAHESVAGSASLMKTSRKGEPLWGNSDDEPALRIEGFESNALAWFRSQGLKGPQPQEQKQHPCLGLEAHGHIAQHVGIETSMPEKGIQQNSNIEDG